MFNMMKQSYSTDLVESCMNAKRCNSKILEQIRKNEVNHCQLNAHYCVKHIPGNIKNILVESFIVKTVLTMLPNCKYDSFFCW